MKVVAMIPARSGSKGIADKNVLKLSGRPLIKYSIDAALGCSMIDEVFLNSDSEAYLELGLKLGAKAFLRPKGLSKDNTSMKLVVINFIEKLKKQERHFDAVIVLYPVYPLRDAGDLERMIKVFKNIGRNRPLIGMKKPDTHPYLCYGLDTKYCIRSVMKFDANRFYRRQMYPKYFEITHWACVLPTESLGSLNMNLINRNTYGYLIPNNINIVDIDTRLDFEYAEFLLERRSKND